MKRLASVAAIAGLAALGVTALSHPANAWRGGGIGIGIYVPPVVVAPPAYYAPPVVYAPPPGYYYGPQPGYWVPAHWEGRYWVRGHWR